LADHSVGGVVLFPGTGFVELVIRAADEVGCTVIDELVLATPLVMQQGAGLQLQVVVGAAGEAGSRTVSVYSRRDQPDAEWLLHAEGMLGVAVAEASADFSVWPPVDAESVDISDGYAQLAARGYEYGPAFQGLVAPSPRRPVFKSTGWEFIQPCWMRSCTPLGLPATPPKRCCHFAGGGCRSMRAALVGCGPA
jgi:acyl transferase domain-containing protein